MEIEKFQNETLSKLAGQERHTLRSQFRPPPTTNACGSLKKIWLKCDVLFHISKLMDNT